LIRYDEGEILFTDYGISGPPILQLSRIASKAISNKQKVKLKVDMMPNKSLEEIENFIHGHLAMFSHRSISTALIGIINKKLIPILLKDVGIYNIHTTCSEIEWENKDLLIRRLKEWTFICTDTNGFNNAQLTAGGVNSKEINENTLESKIIKNLYFTGEILDVNGDCGGFNLQWAWSSGILVGNSI
jgi:predicted Rossmann fold flavoprotein